MRPKLIQCEHCSTFYDPGQHSHCPYCPVPGLDGVSATVGDTIGSVPPAPGPRIQTPSAGGEPPTAGAPSASAAARPHPTPPPAEGVTVGVYNKKMRFDPVVGWLICIAGGERGRDYRIFSDRNFIGRGENMRICIKGDDTISRERHSEINFDARHNAFYIAPGEGRGNTYVNDRPVLQAQQPQAWDVIEIGETKLMFVPLCGPAFTWADGVLPRPQDNAEPA